MASKAALAIASAIFAVQSATAAPAKNGKFIVGGEAAAQGEFPYIVALLSGNFQFCGGTLVNEDTVVTAGHCTSSDVSGIEVRAGSLAWASGGTKVKVRSATRHPDYNGNNYDNDVAVWKLATAIPQSATIKYAKLPAPDSDPAPGANVTVAGWGRLQEGGATPSQLQKVTVPVVDRATCKEAYSTPTPLEITDNMFCAGLPQGGQDACQGDSGGPIVQGDVLLGVVSWGVGCARPNKYGVYTRLGNYVSFIEQYL
ncbi:Peptidase S1/S6, chymotrypsin/Hap [Metarhizium robertsii ARSEF 23]|uniref:Peptidase S1/S6, chymotrypsin/Hap n=2 Tax=Metarhizium TaxID=5529 RepID=E9FBE3_METRA|nr:Peptidase S1/S6, chymotrypsin/Hap [Metarhizium robertsii ARSEF 23]AAD29675.1 trypsin-related protease [Metarhizium anisopliae]EFY94881.1 Peptidase S1/S6, chymotrypsin/Hap [Metarhizium robertsii ARSEF 23]